MQTIIRAAFPAPFDSLSLPQGEAAVLIALRKPDCDLILTQRAAHLNSHAGEVAFPGGRHDPLDASLAVTALRETHEEIGLPPATIELIGMLPARQSRFGIHVVPFVGFVQENTPLSPNPAELASAFEVPLQFFRETSPLLAHEVKYKETRYLMPCFYWQDEIIWGLTARVIINFISHVFGDTIPWPEPRPLD